MVRAFLFLLSLGLIVVVLAGCSNTSSDVVEADLPASLVVEADLPASPANSPAKRIPWQEAKDHVDENGLVFGSVISTSYNPEMEGKPTFLNLGNPAPFPDRFMVIIWREDRGKFDSAPERLYLGKTLLVRGFITEQDGIPLIEVKIPGQIEVLAKQEGIETPTPGE